MDKPLGRIYLALIRGESTLTCCMFLTWRLVLIALLQYFCSKLMDCQIGTLLCLQLGKNISLGLLRWNWMLDIWRTQSCSAKKLWKLHRQYTHQSPRSSWRVQQHAWWLTLFVVWCAKGPIKVMFCATRTQGQNSYIFVFLSSLHAFGFLFLINSKDLVATYMFRWTFGQLNRSGLRFKIQGTWPIFFWGSAGSTPLLRSPRQNLSLNCLFFSIHESEIWGAGGRVTYQRVIQTIHWTSWKRAISFWGNLTIVAWQNTRRFPSWGLNLHPRAGSALLGATHCQIRAPAKTTLVGTHVAWQPILPDTSKFLIPTTFFDLRTLDFAPARGNPRHYSCHLDETMIGVCKSLGGATFCCA